MEAVVDVLESVEPTAPAVEVEAVESVEEVLTETVPSQPPEPPKPSQPNAPNAKDRLHKEIEAAMEADLTDLFLSMPPDKQQLFQSQGEKTGQKIRELATAARKNARKIFDLIVEWLRIIPGVNRFFLEQEAKIKTDKIILLAESGGDL